MDEVKLFSTFSSPFAQRIVWALKLKGIQYETIHEDLANKSSLLLEYNPIHKKVPVLLHNGTAICESLVIVEYIDETWNKSARLLPGDPLARANVRFWAKFNDEELFPSVFNAFVNQGVKQDKAKSSALANLDVVEKQLVGKKFFSGESIGFLDIAFGWIANYLEIIEETSCMKLLDKQRFPLVSVWKDNFCNVPIIKESCPNREKLIIKYQRIHAYFNTLATAQ